MPWENVWGVFNGVNEGDGEALRRTRPLLTFAASLNLTIGGTWTPFTTDVASLTEDGDDAIAASRFDPPAGSAAAARGDAFWTVVNRRSRYGYGADDDNGSSGSSGGSSSSIGDVASFAVAATADSCFYDLYHGENITEQVLLSASAAGRAEFNLTVDPMDYGAVRHCWRCVFAYLLTCVRAA